MESQRWLQHAIEVTSGVAQTQWTVSQIQVVTK